MDGLARLLGIGAGAFARVASVSLALLAVSGGALRLDGAGGPTAFSPVAEAVDQTAVPAVDDDIEELEPLNPKWKTTKASARVPELHGSTIERLLHVFKKRPKKDHLRLRRIPSELMHDINVADEDRLWGLRGRASFTWEEQRDSLTKVGREKSWCLLARDNWQCAGERYEEVLKASPPFNTSAFGIQNWPRSLRVFAEGNSYLAELIYAMICESDVEVWKFERGNSLIAASLSNDATLFLMDNDMSWNNNTTKTMSLLTEIGYVPDVVVMGTLNLLPDGEGNLPPLDEERERAWRTGAFKSSRLVKRNYRGYVLPQTCRAEFKNCDHGYGHQCFPGPLSSFAEVLSSDIMGAKSA